MKQWLRLAGLICMAASGSAASSGIAAPPDQATTAPQKQEAASAQKENGDAKFIRQAAMSSMAEVEHGRLATQNASAAEVKQFGQKMVDDHTKANDELKGLASKKNVTLPTELDEKHRAMQDKLSKLNGAAFDKAYMRYMVSAHQQAVSLFQRESNTGKDVDGRAWARKTLPVLEEHLKMARDINTTVRKGPNKE